MMYFDAAVAAVNDNTTQPDIDPSLSRQNYYSYLFQFYLHKACQAAPSLNTTRMHSISETLFDRGHAL